MLDDIDYSDLSAQPTEAKPAKKSTISERKISSKAERPSPKPVDVGALTEKAAQLESDIGAPKIGDPFAEYALPGMGVLGGLAAAYGLYQASKNKPITGPVIQAPPGPSVNYDVPAYMRNPAAAPVETTPVAPQAPVTPDRLQQAQQLAEANRQAGLGRPVNPAETLAAPAAPMAAPVAPEPIATPLTSAPVDAPAPKPTAGPNSPVTSIVTDTIKELIQETPAQSVAPQPVAPPQELLTGTGKPAFAGQGPVAALNKKGEPKLKVDYASVADVPTGYAFVPGAQYIDTPRQNVGQVEYTKAYTDRPFPLTNEQAIQESKDINKLLGRATRAETKAAGLPPAELTPGITKKTSAGTKPVRVAGTLGALMAVTDLAKAETAAQQGMAGANLLEAILPPGFTMSGAGEGSSAVPNVDAAMLLGSPYAQSEIAKKRRQQEEYTRKVGAGRGIAPPSAYMR